MNRIVFIDTSVFLIAYNVSRTNSELIENLIDEGVIIAVISERVLEELQENLKKYHTEKIAYKILKHLSTTCDIIYRDEIKTEIKLWKGKIKEKDLEHLATAKHLGLKHLVAYDRDFESFEEYRTPKQFVTELGLKPYDSDY